MSTKSIIKDLGGPEKVATLLDVHRTRPYSWMRAGRIPVTHHRAILKYASDNEIDVSAEDLLPDESAAA